MMPDRYEELKRRLFMGEIDHNQAVDEDGNPIIKEEVPVAVVTPEGRRALQDKADMTRNLSHLAVAAGPALMGLLGGGTYAEKASRFKQSDDYLKNVGTINAADKKIVAIKNEEGSPEYIKESNAVGMEPYYQTKGGSSGGQANSDAFAKVDLYNTQTGDQGTFLIGRDRGLYNLRGEQVNLGPEWQKDMGVSTVRTQDAYGNIDIVQVDKNAPDRVKPITKKPGYGAMQGVPEKGLVQLDKFRKEHEKRTGDLEQKKTDLETSLPILENPNANASELTAAREAIIRAITTEPRLTDADVIRAMGNDFRAIYESVRNALTNKGFGEMSKQERKDFLQTSRTLIARLQAGIAKSYEKLERESSTVPGGTNLLSKSKAPIKTTINQNKAKLLQIEKVAKEYYKDNKAGLEAYMNKKRIELGLY